MYNKGLEFVGASILLKQQKGQTSPKIHLLLQGLEIILKSLLIHKDYDKYNNKLKDKFGHNIPKLFIEVKELYGIKNIDSRFDKELKDIYGHYKNNNLRYGGQFDIFIDVTTVNIEIIEAKTYSLIRIIEGRRLNRK